MLARLRADRLSPPDCSYPGCHHAIRLYRKTRGEDAVKVIALDDEYPAKSEGKSLLVWVETPLNPSGQCRSIEHCEWSPQCC